MQIKFYEIIYFEIKTLFAITRAYIWTTYSANNKLFLFIRIQSAMCKQVFKDLLL